MAGKCKNLMGQRFGRLVVIAEADNDKQYANKGKRWVCLCDCGNTTTARADSLKTTAKASGVKSCGCLQKERQKEAITTHGYCGTRLYSEWANMKGRCWYPKHSSYPNYGGRGIVICEEWHDFKPFMDWALSNGYDDALTIDRIDNDGNYEPSNCRWVGNDIQGYNRRVCAKNKTGVTGVRYRIKDRKYEAFIGHKGKQIYLGLFDDVADATKARKAAESIYCPTARL